MVSAKDLAAQLVGRDSLLKNLSQSSDQFLDDKLMDAAVTGRDAAGVLLIDKLAHTVAESFAKQSNAGATGMPAMISRMFSPGPSSLGQMALRFVRASRCPVSPKCLWQSTMLGSCGTRR
jgi:hypothetical protein